MKTSFVTGTGQNLCVIEPGSIASALGRAKLATILTFHALSGTDIIGSEVFLVNENVHAGKAFRDADEDALGSLRERRCIQKRGQWLWSRNMSASFIGQEQTSRK